MIPDLGNAAFEFFGAWFICRSIRRVLKDKAVAGVDPLATGFFAAWGYWNLFYYPHMHQWVSFVAACWMTLVNTVWTALLFYYNRKQE